MAGEAGLVASRILARALAPDRPVLGLQASPDAAQPPPGTSVAQMTQAYADEILAAHPGGPIHLMGFSAGGWYAYAVAAALLQRQAQVGVLALLDTQVTVQIDPRLGPGPANSEDAVQATGQAATNSSAVPLASPERIAN